MEEETTHGEKRFSVTIADRRNTGKTKQRENARYPETGRAISATSASLNIANICLINSH